MSVMLRQAIGHGLPRNNQLPNGSISGTLRENGLPIRDESKRNVQGSLPSTSKHKSSDSPYPRYQVTYKIFPQRLSLGSTASS